MKTRFLKAIALLLVLCTLSLSLTGCDDLDYRDALKLYNARRYDEAAQIFEALGEFENSQTMLTQCHYWKAVDTMEAGDYAAAIQSFQALNGYEDSAARITECKYQLALAAFEGGDFTGAEELFLGISDYRRSPEYLRQITWQKLYDAVAAAGELAANADGKDFSVTAQDGQLMFAVSTYKEDGYRFQDGLTVTLTRESMLASYSALSTFTMDFKGQEIGSRQEASGRLDITTCTPETPLVHESFLKTVTDNLGATTTSSDPADSKMEETLAQLFRDLMILVPQMLAENGIETTLTDIGFPAM